MFFKLLLAFTIIPLIEIYILMKIGARLGAINTIALVVITGTAGAYLARLQGMRVMFHVRTSIQQGIIPEDDILDAFLILIAGIVLITPGLITDITGLILLIPKTRRIIHTLIRLKLIQWISNKRDGFNMRR